MNKSPLPIFVLLLAMSIVGILGFMIGAEVGANIVINQFEGPPFTSKVLHILAATFILVCIAASHFNDLQANKSGAR
jgi:hypothetical protein